MEMPEPIATFVQAANSGDADAVSECFAPYATVRDDDEYYEGRPAIKAWKATSQDQEVTPLDIEVSDGGATLRARLSGKSTRKPVTAKLRFALVDDQIASLQILS
jgi:SnoaL-like domain